MKDGVPAVRIQPRSGSAFYAKEFKTEGTHLSVLWANGTTTWDLDVKDGKLAGSEKRDGKPFADLAGVRAPLLKRNPPKEWTAPEPMFNGKDLTGWEPTDPAATNHWVAKDGELLNESKGANLQSTRKFDDFKLHIELNCPRRQQRRLFARALRDAGGVREVMPRQVSQHGVDLRHVAGRGVLPRTPGKWESFDITLVGRRVTIVRNGVTLADNQEIAGITGGAIDSNEGEPGVFYIQGDHTGGMKYRNITIQVPKK